MKKLIPLFLLFFFKCIQAENSAENLNAFWSYTPIQDSVGDTRVITDPDAYCAALKNSLRSGEINLPLYLQTPDWQTARPACLYVIGRAALERRISTPLPQGAAMEYIDAASRAGVVQATLFLLDHHRSGTLVRLHRGTFDKLIQRTPAARAFLNYAALLGQPAAKGSIEAVEALEGSQNFAHYHYLQSGIAAQTDPRAQIEFLRRAASEGHRQAAYELGRLLTKEAQRLTPESLYWYNLARFWGVNEASTNIAAYSLRMLASNKAIPNLSTNTSTNQPRSRIEPLLALAERHIAYGVFYGQNRLKKVADTLDSLNAFLKIDMLDNLRAANPGLFKRLVNTQPAGALYAGSLRASPIKWKQRACGVCEDATPVYDLVAKTGSDPDRKPLRVTLNLGLFNDKIAQVTLTKVLLVDSLSGKTFAPVSRPQPAPLKLEICADWTEAICGFVGKKQALKYEFEVDREAGMYLLWLRSPEVGDFQPSPVFVQPDPETTRDVLVAPTFTWQAYNRAGGGSLYYTPVTDKVYAVGLGRPMNHGIVTSHHNYRSSLAVARFIYLRTGKRLTQVSQAWLDKVFQKTNALKTITSVGHDEYWTEAISKGLRQFVDNDGRLLLLSGNTGWFQVMLDDKRLIIDKGDLKNAEEVALLSGRLAIQDLATQLPATGLTMSARIDRNIERLSGLTYESGGYAAHYIRKPEDLEKYHIDPLVHDESDKMFVLDPAHKIFDGLGVSKLSSVCNDVLVIDNEIDAAPLIGPQFKLNPQWLPRMDKRSQPLLAAYVLNLNFPAMNRRISGSGFLHFSAVSTYVPTSASGFVLTLGSMGAYNMANTHNRNCQNLLLNMWNFIATTK